MSCAGDFETPKTRRQLRQRARDNWAYWRLIFDGHMDYETVFCRLTPNEITEANAALDHYIDLMNKAQEGE